MDRKMLIDNNKYLTAQQNDGNTTRYDSSICPFFEFQNLKILQLLKLMVKLFVWVKNLK